MSTTTVKQLQTLKGVFGEPKINHRRDFLRENKLSLRELQRVTNKKIMSQQQDQQMKMQRHHLQHQQQQQMYAGRRRSASYQRGATPQPMAAAARTSNTQATQQPRYKSQQRLSTTNCPTCCANGRGGYMPNTVPTTASLASRAESCDKQIQTEDINDEKFLYEALKKCSSGELSNAVDSNAYLPYEDDAQRLAGGNSSDSNIQQGHRNGLEYADDGAQQGYYNQNYQNDDNYAHEQQNLASNHYNNNNDDAESGGMPLSATRSRTSIASRGQQHNQHNPQYETSSDEKLNNRFSNLSMDNEQQHMLQQQQNTQPMSSRSRRTIRSTNSHESILSKKTNSSSLHKLGSRDDVRLPRYLEREKREKEAQRMLEMERDPNCPLGHYALTDDERKSALAMAEKKFKALINELNRLPMTNETLRIRTRKAEIDKELGVLEGDIRLFSKPKVYVKQENIQQQQ